MAKNQRVSSFPKTWAIICQECSRAPWPGGTATNRSISHFPRVPAAQDANNRPAMRGRETTTLCGLTLELTGDTEASTRSVRSCRGVRVERHVRQHACRTSTRVEGTKLR